MLSFMKKSKEPAQETPCGGGINFMSAIEAHVRWKIRLEAYIAGTSEEQLDPEVVCRDDQCPLGKWIYSDGGQQYGDNPEFEAMRLTHAKFHQCAGDVIRLVDEGNKEEASRLLCSGDYASHSHQIKSKLARLALELEGD